jgi:adenylate cyclase
LKRRFTTIPSTDVEGHSRLMIENEETIIRTHISGIDGNSHSEILGSGGRLSGDNLLAEFASVVDAVICAVEIQQKRTRRQN